MTTMATYVVKVAHVLPGDKRPYLRDGVTMSWTTQKRARRFNTRKEALDYVVETGWPRKDNGLKIMRLTPRR